MTELGYEAARAQYLATEADQLRDANLHRLATLLEDQADLPFEADRCGTCRRCLDACPTQAFAGPGDLDARACISYLTIEHRGEFTETERAQVGDWLFGCDVCQDVCPWNISFARQTHDPGFAPHPDVAAPDVRALLTLEDEEFDRRYGASPFTRPGRRGMRRNAAAILHDIA